MFRRFIALWASVLVVALAFVVSPPASAAPSATTRLAGQDRFETAVEVSQATFDPGVGAVFVANGLNFPDGLAGGPAAARLGGPLLLTRTDRVSDGVLAEIERLQPEAVYLLGGTSVVSAAVADEIAQRVSGPVRRMAGSNRYATAAQVAGLWDSPATVFLASGAMFPDALSGGAAAARSGAPLLLTRPEALPAATRQALADLEPATVVVVGGPGAVSDSVITSLRGASQGVDVVRVGGDDRYATSAKLIEYTQVGSTNAAVLASGLAFPDALSSVPAAAALSATFAITRSDCMPPSVDSALGDAGVDTYVLVGGAAVLESSVVSTVCSPAPDPELPNEQKRVAIISLTNDERTDRGRGALSQDSCLMRNAQRHAERLAERGSLEHQDLRDVLSECPGFRAVAENILWNQIGTPASIVDQWMKSAGHRANILNATYDRIGTGLAYDAARDRFYAVQVFGDTR